MPTVKFNGTDIYYTDNGPQNAPAIVFSPLLYMDASIYQPMIDAFSDEYRVICYDHRGQGQSSRVNKKSDLQTSIQDAIHLIEHLKIEPCHFVGNCLGAYVGLNLAVQRSDLLKSCTVMGAVAESESIQTIKEMDHFLDSMKKHGAKSGMESFANMAFGASFRASKDPSVVAKREKLLEHFSKLSPDELENMRQVFHHRDLSKEDLKKISVPVLIIAGDEDQPHNISAYKRLGLEIPHVAYKTVQHAGYALVVEQPYEVIHLVRDHIEKAERSYTAQVTQSKPNKGKTARL
ncbi:alpha/beta fold hydrolase [Bdellovibrio sp. HCB337]|uniref:alpha/beta fold hydrolase n=1 Tax=Bdellovibrio sp. HCB337 TaxID=3394358 RepID=UPI0039A71764